MNHEDRGHWGDLLKRHKEDNFRLLFLNTGGIEITTEERSKDTLKLEKPRGICNVYNIDMAYLTEISKDWRLEQRHTIWNATAT